MIKFFRNSNFIKRIKKRNNDDVDLLDVKGIEYLRDKIFSSLMMLIIVFAMPIFIYGMYLFIKEGNYFGTIVNATGMTLLFISLKVKMISKQVRKIIVVLSFYSIGIIILIETGIYGSGFVIIFFSLILAAFFLEKKISARIVLFNILTFIVLTIFLLSGLLDNQPIALFKATWLLNVYIVQLYSVASFLLMNIMFDGLKEQSIQIKKANTNDEISKKRYQKMIANIIDVIVIVDTLGAIKYISPNVEEFYGWKREEVFGSSLFEKINKDDRDEVTLIFKKFLKEQKKRNTIKIRHHCKNGEVKDFEATLTNLCGDPVISGVLINFHDTTERRRYQKKIIHISHHDELTGLYNRAYFNQIKNQLDREDHLPVSLISADIDDLKMINDSFGHHEGDEILKLAAKVFKDSFRKEDIIARVGGDEFCIVLPKTSLDASYRLIERIRTKIDVYNHHKTNKDIYLSISMGVATKTSIDENIDAVLQNADYQMYEAKNIKKEKRIVNDGRTAVQKEET